MSDLNQTSIIEASLSEECKELYLAHLGNDVSNTV